MSFEPFFVLIAGVYVPHIIHGTGRYIYPHFLAHFYYGKMYGKYTIHGLFGYRFGSSK